MTVLKCLLGKNFTNIIYISSNGGAREYCAFPKLMVRTTNSMMELVALSKATALVACK